MNDILLCSDIIIFVSLLIVIDVLKRSIVIMLGLMTFGLIVLITPILIALMPVLVPYLSGSFLLGLPTIISTLFQEFANADWDLIFSLFN